MKYVELGAYFGAILFVILLVGVSLYFLGVWAFVHNKLRAERQADATVNSKENQ